jgi:hypothetical protein
LLDGPTIQDERNRPVRGHPLAVVLPDEVKCVPKLGPPAEAYPTLILFTCVGRDPPGRTCRYTSAQPVCSKPSPSRSWMTPRSGGRSFRELLP